MISYSNNISFNLEFYDELYRKETIYKLTVNFYIYKRIGKSINIYSNQFFSVYYILQLI